MAFPDWPLLPDRGGPRTVGDCPDFAEPAKQNGTVPLSQTVHGQGLRIAAELPLESELRPAEPGTLEHFLVERYVFYNQSRSGQWQQGRVRHPPYRIAPARLVECQETLLAAGGIAVDEPPCHVVFSPGVDVEIVSLGPPG